MLLCRTFNAGGVTVRNREVNLPYKQDGGDDDTDDISGVVTKHCAANGARTVAVAVNFSDRVSRLPSAGRQFNSIRSFEPLWGYFLIHFFYLLDAVAV